MIIMGSSILLRSLSNLPYYLYSAIINGATTFPRNAHANMNRISAIVLNMFNSIRNSPLGHIYFHLRNIYTTGNQAYTAARNLYTAFNDMIRAIEQLQRAIRNFSNFFRNI
jgi:CRISPR/Cas system CSM-associated protein Csm2 small subunit